MASPSARFYPAEGDRVIRAIMKIALNVQAAHGRSLRCCGVCGCLIRHDEACPACRINAASGGYVNGHFRVPA